MDELLENELFWSFQRDLHYTSQNVGKVTLPLVRWTKLLSKLVLLDTAFFLGLQVFKGGITQLLIAKTNKEEANSINLGQWGTKLL